MARKRPTPEEIVAKLPRVDALVSQSKSVADASFAKIRESMCDPKLNSESMRCRQKG